MNIRQAKEITGGLGNPSKMPGYSYNLPTSHCPTGKYLRKVKESVCYSCYACKGRYRFKNVQNALSRRLAAIRYPEWVDAMSFLITHYCAKVPYFRFHDSGDLQDKAHLERILEVCNNCKDIHFWLPTLEHNTVYFTFADKEIPDNLNIRLSTAMVNDAPLDNVMEFVTRKGASSSSVASDISIYPKTIICPATMNHTDCGACRRCWDSDFKHVIYMKH